jgi:hypothetical protein
MILENYLFILEVSSENEIIVLVFVTAHVPLMAFSKSISHKNILIPNFNGHFYFVTKTGNLDDR